MATTAGLIAQDVQRINNGYNSTRNPITGPTESIRYTALSLYNHNLYIGRWFW